MLTDSHASTESWEYCLYIPNDLRAVTVSRRTLRLILTLHGLIRLVDVAELLAAELISNAVQHTKGPAALRVRWAAGKLRIGAWDADPAPPESPAPLEQVARPMTPVAPGTRVPVKPVPPAAPVTPVPEGPAG
ncbi:hypothetical protein ABT024_40120, partial [Streptomyces sp. NPDC002812]